MANQEFTPEEIATEEWRNIVGYEGYYQVSTLGRVRGLPRRIAVQSNRLIQGKILKPAGEPYLQVGLAREGKAATHRVHILVARAFIGPCPQGFEVNHEDTNKQNNRSTNLSYLTPSGNALHAIRMGTRACGARMYNAKLNDEKVREIRALIVAGYTLTSIAAQYGVVITTIPNLKHGHIWRHVI